MSKSIGDSLSFQLDQAHLNELKRVAENRAMLHGEDDQQTILAWCALATALEDDGEIIDAGEIFIHALEKMEIDPGFDHPHTLIIATKVAIFLREKGNLDSSEKMFERILKTLECAPDPDYDFIFTNLSAMGRLMEFADRLPEAAELHKRALEGRTELFGPDHERTRFSALRLAAVLEKMPESKTYPRHENEQMKVYCEQILAKLEILQSRDNTMADLLVKRETDLDRRSGLAKRTITNMQTVIPYDPSLRIMRVFRLIMNGFSL